MCPRKQTNEAANYTSLYRRYTYCSVCVRVGTVCVRTTCFLAPFPKRRLSLYISPPRLRAAATLCAHQKLAIIIRKRLQKKASYF